MNLFADYALLGTLIAGSAGVVVLVLTTAKHGLTRRRSRRGDRGVRVADTAAVLCFALSAGFGVLGLMLHTRGLDSSSATQDRLLERLTAVEKRVETAESQLARNARTVMNTSPSEPRTAHIESRSDGVDDRSARSNGTSATPHTPVPKVWSRVSDAPALDRSRRYARSTSAGTSLVTTRSRSVDATASRSVDATALVTETAPPAPARFVAPPREPTFAEHTASGWDALKRDVKRGGDDWREGWQRLRRVFSD